MTGAVLLMLLCLTQAGLAQQPAGIAGFTGTYVGEVFNGDDMDPITTVFQVAGGNRLTGEYRVGAEQGDYEGMNSGIAFEDAWTITGEWTDQFGEGFLQLQFSRDFSSFTGFWSNYDSDMELPWNGTRQ